MTTYKIDLSEDEARRLQELARASRLEPEELLRRGVAEWLTKRRADFAEAAEYVVRKNAALYDRLS